MNELLKINTDKKGINSVSGRELHEFLNVKTRYDKWFERMCEYGFKEDKDFKAVAQKRPTAQGNETTFIDHFVSIDMAKEISMLQRNEQGKKARLYFIACEKEITQRKELYIESKKDRKGLTAEWKRQGCNKPHHYINLTKEEYGLLFNDTKKKKAEMNIKELAKLNAFEAYQRWSLLDKSELGYDGCKKEIQSTRDVFGFLPT